MILQPVINNIISETQARRLFQDVVFYKFSAGADFIRPVQFFSLKEEQPACFAHLVNNLHNRPECNEAITPFIKGSLSHIVSEIFNKVVIQSLAFCMVLDGVSGPFHVIYFQ
jgi:hypothetical protein